jgi:hypothetical protein
MLPSVLSEIASLLCGANGSLQKTRLAHTSAPRDTKRENVKSQKDKMPRTEGSLAMVKLYNGVLVNRVRSAKLFKKLLKIVK